MATQAFAIKTNNIKRMENVPVFRITWWIMEVYLFLYGKRFEFISLAGVGS